MEDIKENVEINTVRSVERSLDILLCFVHSTELSLTEITNLVSLHKSTVYRMLQTLELKGFLIKNNSNEKYRLGFKIWELSANLSGMNDPATLFLPEMERLRNLLDETISLYIRDGYERIRIQSIESNQSLRRVAPIGERLPLALGASSKVLITYEEKSIQEDILKQLASNYQIDKNSFEKVIEDVKILGYATSFEERAIGAVAIACPIFNRQKSIIAALSVSGPVNRLTYEKLEEIAPVLTASCSKLQGIIN
ncbi:MAG: IclR family transcriptional regulator [Vulcanibacillus sp.]